MGSTGCDDIWWYEGWGLIPRKHRKHRKHLIPLHRSILWPRQGGQTFENEEGSGGESIYGPAFEDEASCPGNATIFHGETGKPMVIRSTPVIPVQEMPMSWCRWCRKFRKNLGSKSSNFPHSWALSPPKPTMLGFGIHTRPIPPPAESSHEVQEQRLDCYGQWWAKHQRLAVLHHHCQGAVGTMGTMGPLCHEEVPAPVISIPGWALELQVGGLWRGDQGWVTQKPLGKEEPVECGWRIVLVWLHIYIYIYICIHIIDFDTWIVML